jgi:mannose-6-phosphate isomerase-like protein (cupin superfamily)
MSKLSPDRPGLEKVNFSEKFSSFEDFWSPKIVAELNDVHVKLVKLKGEFIWHNHENEDELFLVTKGDLTIKLRGEDVHLKKGEFFVVPKGIEHKPEARAEVHVVLIEPKTTINTGNIRNKRTVEKPDRI